MTARSDTGSGKPTGTRKRTARSGTAVTAGPGGHLRRTTSWAGVRRGDRVEVAVPRMRGASWTFVAHVVNTVTAAEWVEVVGGRSGDRALRSFRPEQVFPVTGRGTRRPSLAEAPQLQLGP
ncbi:MAG: DUF7246 family protein [Acidimicrobiales bacterium]